MSVNLGIKMKLSYLSIVIIVFISCAKTGNEIDSRNAQVVSTRTIIDVKYDSVRFKNLDETIFTTQNYEIDGDFLFISNFVLGKVFQYRLSTGDLIATYGKGIGRGPGQFTKINGLDVHQSRIAIFDESLFKVAIFDRSTSEVVAEHLLDIRPHRLNFINDSTLIIVSPNSDHFISQFNLNTGLMSTVFKGFNEVAPLKYEGFIATNNETVVFAGYSEPMLFRVNINGDLIYLRAAIENYETDLNYANSTTGDQVRLGYSSAAQYYALSTVISDDYVFVHGINNTQSGDKSYIDIYDLESGDYLYSVSKPNKPVGGLTLHDQKLTFISYDEDAIVFYSISVNDVKNKKVTN